MIPRPQIFQGYLRIAGGGKKALHAADFPLVLVEASNRASFQRGMAAVAVLRSDSLQAFLQVSIFFTKNI